MNEWYIACCSVRWYHIILHTKTQNGIVYKVVQKSGTCMGQTGYRRTDKTNATCKGIEASCGMDWRRIWPYIWLTLERFSTLLLTYLLSPCDRCKTSMQTDDISFWLFMSPPPIGIMFSGCLSVSVSVRACVRACVLLARYLRTQRREFHQAVADDK